MKTILFAADLPAGVREPQGYRIVGPGLEEIGKSDAIVAIGMKIDAAFLDRGPNLKIISNYGAGYDSIDVPEATRRGLPVATIPDTVTEATAEMAFVLMLSAMRRIAEFDRTLREGRLPRWGGSETLGHSAFGRTLGIVGMGRIGRALARRARASGMNIVYHNRTRLSPVLEQESGAAYLSFDELLSVSDVVSLNAPAQRDAPPLLAEREFALMKRGSWLVNTARGALVDEAALIAALKSGHLAGAGLDVFAHEPRIPEELLAMKQVVLSPHAGSATIETRKNMAEAAIGQIIDYFEGRPLKSCVNPETLTKP